MEFAKKKRYKISFLGGPTTLTNSRRWNLCLMPCNTSSLVWQGVSNIFKMLKYFNPLMNFKHFGSSTCSNVHNQSHDTDGQHETGGLNLNMWTCWRSKVFDISQMLLLLFCLNKDQFWFLLKLRTSSAEILQKKEEEKNARNCKLLSPQDNYRCD